MAQRKTTKSSAKPSSVKPTSRNPWDNAIRTELSINDIRGLAWNSVQGSSQSYEILESQYLKLAKLANSRMRVLRKEHLDMFAYDRAITYLENHDWKKFPMKFADPTDFRAMVDQMSELTSFINSKTSTVSGARDALNKKLDKIAEFTGKEYTNKQRENLGRLLGTDSVSTLLRDIRGDSAEVIDALEDLSLVGADKNRILEIVDRYLQGWMPWDNTASWLTKSRGMNYDELLDALIELYDKTIEDNT